MMTPSPTLELARRAYRKARRTWWGPPTKAQLFGQPILPAPEGNRLIAERLQTGRPLMVSRLGTAELICITNHVHIQQMAQTLPWLRWWRAVQGANADWTAKVVKGMSVNAGFFPATPPMLARFSEFFIEATRQIDVLGVWNEEDEDAYFHRHYFPQAAPVELRAIEPYYHPSPWSQHLAGKRVVVVHPFADSIARQYAQRERLFPDPGVLPAFDLRLVRAVQSIAGQAPAGFATWFDAYDHMCGQIAAQDYDVALIGAGAYGLPLAAFVKQSGKMAVHIGGATQVLFGIRGKRWDDHPEISRFFNPYWSRPLPSEVPEGFRKVEEGCYW
jgi:hypothetical protein